MRECTGIKRFKIQAANKHLRGKVYSIHFGFAHCESVNANQALVASSLQSEIPQLATRTPLYVQFFLPFQPQMRKKNTIYLYVYKHIYIYW